MMVVRWVNNQSIDRTKAMRVQATAVVYRRTICDPQRRLARRQDRDRRAGRMSFAATMSPVHVDRAELAAVFAGGFAGAIARAGVAEGLANGDGWPWATFLVNVVGAVLLGYLATRLQERLPLSAYRRPLLGTGLCGALTTFSAMQLELLRMLDDARYALACGYVLASLAAGFAGVALATNVVRRGRLAR
jgi:CrcB protein